MNSSTPDPIASTVLAYHDGAARYAEHSRDRSGLKRLRGRLMELLPEHPGRSEAGGPSMLGNYRRVAFVLDLGSGAGHDAALLAEAGATVVALDPALGLLREAGAYEALGGRRVCGDARRLPFADESFDGIWSCASLLHVPHAEVPQALREAHRVLRPGGVALFSVSEGEATGRVPVSDLGLETRGYYYHRDDDWAAIVRGAGLELLDHRVNRTVGNFNPGSTGWIETFAGKRG